MYACPVRIGVFDELSGLERERLEARRWAEICLLRAAEAERLAEDEPIVTIRDRYSSVALEYRIVAEREARRANG